MAGVIIRAKVERVYSYLYHRNILVCVVICDKLTVPVKIFKRSGCIYRDQGDHTCNVIAARDCSEFLVRGWGVGVWVMVGVQGRVAFGLSHFCILSFQKKV